MKIKETFCFFVLCLGISCVSLFAASQRDVYSWQEHSGTRSYGDVPPPGTHTKKVVTNPASGRKTRLTYEDVQPRGVPSERSVEEYDQDINRRIQERNRLLSEQKKEMRARNCDRVKLNQESLMSVTRPANPKFHRKLVEQNQKDLERWCHD